jgi:hypothetical protein
MRVLRNALKRRISSRFGGCVERIRKSAEKLIEEERIAKLREKALASSDIDRLFELFDLFFEDTEGDSSLRV